MKRSLTKLSKPPTAYLVRTASPFVYIASYAAESYEIDPQELFTNHQLKPRSFLQSTFSYIPPKAFGHELPRWNIPEVAFLGRSNVGKSSLVNAVMGKQLARCSKRPGRTQQVNYFAQIPNAKDLKFPGSSSPSNASGFVVDLPGYGFAKAPDKNVAQWQESTQDFLLQRRDHGTLQRVFLLVDVRRGANQIDRDVMGWFDEAEIDYSVILTKSDRVGKPQAVRFANELCMRYQSQMLSGGGCQGPLVHLTSSRDGTGIMELMESVESDFLEE